MRGAESVRGLGPRWGPERCENAAWEKGASRRARGWAGENKEFFSILLVSPAVRSTIGS